MSRAREDPCQVRPVQETDLDRCAEIFAQAFTSAPYHDKWSRRDARRKLEKLWQVEPDYAFCAEAAGRSIGAVFGRVSSWWVGDCLVVEELFVHPDHQGSGAGKALMEAVETRAKERGVDGMWLIANRRASALDFYKRLGLVEAPDVAVMLKQFPDCP